MSLETKEENKKVVNNFYRQREDNVMAERAKAYHEMSIRARLREAEVKEKNYMELDASDEFLLKNKSFFKKMLGEK